MPAKQKTLEEEIAEATDELHKALLESIQASKAETEIQVKKRKAHSRVLSAEQRLNSLRWEAMK